MLIKDTVENVFKKREMLKNETKKFLIELEDELKECWIYPDVECVVLTRIEEYELDKYNSDEYDSDEYDSDEYDSDEYDSDEYDSDSLALVFDVKLKCLIFRHVMSKYDSEMLEYTKEFIVYDNKFDASHFEYGKYKNVKLTDINFDIGLDLCKKISSNAISIVRNAAKLAKSELKELDRCLANIKSSKKLLS